MINSLGWILLILIIFLALVVVILCIKFIVDEIKITKKTTKKIIGILIIILSCGLIIWLGCVFKIIVQDQLSINENPHIEWISNERENLILKKDSILIVLYKDENFAPRKFVGMDANKVFFRNDSLEIQYLGN